MSSQNSDNKSYARAVKETGTPLIRVSSSVASNLPVQMPKRKRETSSSSSSTIDSSSSSKFEDSSSEIITEVISHYTYTNRTAATQTEDDDALMDACIEENKLLKLRDEKFQLQLDLQLQREKSVCLSRAICKILDLSVAGLAASNRESVIRDQEHSIQFSGAFEIRPEALVFDEDFWKPLMELHKSWDKELQANKIASLKFKNALGSIITECRSMTARFKKIHPLVIKSKVLTHSLDSNKTSCSKSKEAKRAQSARLCNSQSPENEEKSPLSEHSNISYIQFSKEFYNQSISTPIKTKAHKLPISARSKPSSISFPSTKDSMYLKARKVRFAQKHNDSPTKKFVKPELEESLIEIEIPNVKVIVPVKNQDSADMIEFTAQFPDLREIVDEKIKEFREKSEKANLDNFEISRDFADAFDDSKFWEDLCKKEAFEEK